MANFCLFLVPVGMARFHNFGGSRIEDVVYISTTGIEDKIEED